MRPLPSGVCGPARFASRDQSARVTPAVRVCVFLIVMTAIVYGQAVRFDFVGAWDDFDYVTDNWWVRQGITWKGLRWALVSAHASNWHPLTWLSHMVDCQLGGLNPALHHLTNVLWHTLNAVVLFLLLNRMTGSLWRSAFVATIFALHPLQVESVAWVSERKNVLSTFFGLLSIWAYVDYARGRGMGRYLISFVCLGAGLMAKPMLVTWPFVFLLLDYWPLGRIPVPRFGHRNGTRGGDRNEPSGSVPPARGLGVLLLEKVPMLVLAVGSSVVTCWAQRVWAVRSEGADVSLGLRAANAVVCWGNYVVQMIWPSRLGPLYLHPGEMGGVPLAPRQVMLAVLFLIAVTMVVFLARHHRYLAVGWLWYLGTLVPVIGLVKVGHQSMADRYMYVPSIGLLITAVWGTGLLLSKSRLNPGLVRRTTITLSVASILLCATCAFRQTQYWRDAVTLSRRGVETAPHSVRMLSNLAIHLHNDGQSAEAVGFLQRALLIDPGHSKVHYNMGIVLAGSGKPYEAMEAYRQAIKTEPNNSWAHNNLGLLLEQTEGNLQGAISHYRRALESDRSLFAGYHNMGHALLKMGCLSEAMDSFTSARRLNPRAALNLSVMAWILATCPERDIHNPLRAVVLAEEAVAATSRRNWECVGALAVAYAANGQLDWAVQTAREALELPAEHQPRNAELAEQMRQKLQLIARESCT